MPRSIAAVGDGNMGGVGGEHEEEVGPRRVEHRRHVVVGLGAGEHRGLGRDIAAGVGDGDHRHRFAHRLEPADGRNPFRLRHAARAGDRDPERPLGRARRVGSPPHRRRRG